MPPVHRTPFAPPPYPYARLDTVRAAATRTHGEVVDLSVGSPCDPPSTSVLKALAEPDAGGATRSYPSSAGSPAARRAAATWMTERLGAEVDASCVALCIGTKELVAGLPSWLNLRRPDRDTVLYPALSYPTYEMGAVLAGLRPVAVPVDDEFRLRLDAVRAEDAGRALLLWANSPGNPAGQLDDLVAVAAWGREHDVLVASDECYAEHTWAQPPSSVLSGTGGDHTGLLALHSLSKRSNLAGLRFGWYAGDPEVVAFVREVRQHAGFMVPGPAQRAGIVALEDTDHAGAQRDRYHRRLLRLRQVLDAVGVPATMPEGGIYLWARAPGGDSWAFTQMLAEKVGMIVSPGEFYGPTGDGFVRVAAVATDEAIETLAVRAGLG
ncbi:MAG TPA: pyridoxal phosphate-dependent aminotransferase [Acidimicrobiales bacterium]|nr:pyridoxal phosphate-dependent aminotransferase [Acidimicrobiales bacterium]